MDSPRYTVTVTSITNGWSYSAEHGELADVAPEDLPDVILVAPLTYEWAFTDEALPSQLNPFQATVNLIALDGSSLPDVAQGDLLSIDVRVGTTGDRVIAPQAMRVTDARVTLRRHRYAAFLAIGLVDLSPDWSGLQPGIVEDTSIPITARKLWRERLAEIANRIGFTIGCPTTWSDTEQPTAISTGAPNLVYIGSAFAGSARDNLTELINSHHPSSTPHTWVTVYAPSGHPTGYRRVGPDTWSFSGGVPDPLTEPVTDTKIEAVPASRRIAGATAGLPLQLIVVDGLLTVESREPPAGGNMARLGVDAEWCDLPTTARRSRESAVNRVTVLGQADNYTEDGTTDPYADYHYEVNDSDDQSSRGVITARELPTQLRLPGTDASSEDPEYAANAEAAGEPFLSDPDDSWAYDGFALRSKRVPQDVADWMLPVIAPRLPGETDSDGRLVRHVVIYNLSPEFRFSGEPMVGFIVAGAMVIQGGEISFELRMIPGLPVETTASTPVTFAEFEALVAGLDNTDIDPNLTYADLAYVDS